MNVIRRIQDLLAARFAQRNFGQNAEKQLYWNKSFMLLSFARKIALCCGLSVGIPGVVFGQTNYYAANGTEYAIAGHLPGDQVFPDAAVTPGGGFVVWQDNITDGDGLGISAMQLNVLGSSFRVSAGRGRSAKPARGIIAGWRRSFRVAGWTKTIPAHLRAVSFFQQHVPDNERRACGHVHK